MGKGFGATAQFGFAIQGFEALGNTLAKFVELLEPVAVEHFTIALRDMTAEIGRILLPVFKATTEVVKLMGDTVHELAPPLIRIVNSFLDPLLKAIPKLWASMTPLFNALEKMSPALEMAAESLGKLLASLLRSHALEPISEAIIVLMPLIDELANQFNFLMEVLTLSVDGMVDLMHLLGGTPEGTKPHERGGGVGTAVRPARIQSIEDYGQQARQAAFSLGTGDDPAKKTARNTDVIAQLLRDIPERIWQLLPESIRKAAIAIGNAINNPGKSAGDVATNVFSPVTNTVKNVAKTAGVEIPERTKGTWTSIKDGDVSGFLGSL